MVKELKVTGTFSIYEDISDLPEAYKRLIEAAGKAALDAHAPYSNFQVGAAVIDENNKVTIGSNQENAAYPSGLCAERVAIFSAAANEPGVKIEAIAVVAFRNKEQKSSMPCGACRQVIREYETKQGTSIKIIMVYKDGNYLISNGAEDLLPLSFTKTDL
jgi:cytidine deaminase